MKFRRIYYSVRQFSTVYIYTILVKPSWPFKTFQITVAYVGTWNSSPFSYFYNINNNNTIINFKINQTCVTYKSTINYTLKLCKNTSHHNTSNISNSSYIFPIIFPPRYSEDDQYKKTGMYENNKICTYERKLLYV